MAEIFPIRRKTQDNQSAKTFDETVNLYNLLITFLLSACFAKKV